MTGNGSDGPPATPDLVRGRECYEQRRWADAFEAFRRAERRASLGRDDLDRLALSAGLLAKDDVYLATLERLHQACVSARAPRAAARAAFWIGFRLFGLGSPARASGWLARAGRHLEGEDEGCAERGYLMLPEVFAHLGAGDDRAAAAAAARAAAIGRRCGDRDLVALAQNLEARALVRQGRMKPGLALLDEVMVLVTSEGLSPLVTGIVYCSVIDTCQQIQAVDRAREWTEALATWCDEQAQLVSFTGICLVHRSEIMQLGGAWPEAIRQVQAVCDGPAKDADPEIVGDALYQRAELHRLRGELTEAETAYRRASERGREPQPGLALLRLAQARAHEAASAIDRVMHTTTVPWRRARILPAYVEIMLAAGELDKARAACRELEKMAEDFGTEIVGAMAAHARGAIHLADGEAKAAIEPLRHAFAVWHRVGAPYLAARLRVLLSRAFRALGDVDGARLELEAARRVFERLGAALDLAALEPGDEGARQARAHGLSPRELEVLRLVASGKTNKAIARELGVSERTIHRHLSNIFTKLDVPSRAAATAFAYEHGLV